MHGEPTVSVILPVWNGQRFLAEAIESVTQQTFDSFELIVIDDGSTDGTRPIADGFARRDPRLTVTGQPHSGIVTALNFGIQASRGRYIARMDADDYSLPPRLAKQVAFLDTRPDCVAVGCDVEVIDANSSKIGLLRFPERHLDIAEALMNGRSALAHPSVVMRKEAVLRAGGYRASQFPSEDFDLWMRLCEIGELGNLSEALLRYRRHKDAVGVRERAHQLAAGAAIADRARLKQGLPPVTRWHVPMATNLDAIYHFECARIALKSGLRRATVRHASATITSAPLWPLAYAALAASALPRRTLPFLGKVYTRLSGRRPPSGD